MTTVGDARKTYSSLLRSYNMQKFDISVKRNELQERIKETPNGATLYKDEAAKLDLTYDALAEKYDEYKEYMNRVMEKFDAKHDEIVAQQQSEATKKGFEDLGKIMEVARRIMKGDTVPLKDEKKLAEYDKDLYMMAKNAGMLAEVRKRKKHKSLWEDEEPTKNVDAMEEADAQDMEEGPEIVSVEETMASADSSGEAMSESFD